MNTQDLLNQRYLLEETLAQGTDSEVYKAQDTLKNRTVFIKAFFSNALQDWKRFQLIEREAKTLAQINYIQIPDFIDLFVVGPEHEQTIYLVTEWVPGESLAQKQAGGWKPAMEELVPLADQILQTLHYIHSFDPPIVHRDIKPSNLILNSYNRVFLVDFGGVQEELQHQGAGGSTMVGTLGYMSPEQLAGRAVPASDLFALGMTFLELLTGQSAETLNPQKSTLNIDKLLRTVPVQWRDWLKALVALPLEERLGSAQDALRYIDLFQNQAERQRKLFTPQDHRARLPEILHSLTLIERSEEDHTLVQGSLLEGRYEIDTLLGSGTHSRVYTATDKKRQRPVVLKELCLENIENWKNLELFEREIETMQRIQHPRIPEFIDAFDIREGQALNWYLVTEAIEGQTLDEKLSQGWRPVESTVWDMAQSVLEIMVHLHQLSPPLVHRDIKPSNLIVSDTHEVYLIDFGAVQNRFWSQGAGGSTIIGTFGYMAPEQFGGQADPKSDLYALAATLVRMLTLKHPIEIPFEAQGLQFGPFVNVDPFYEAWLRACLHPLVHERLSPEKALELLKDYQNQGSLAEEWLLSQTFEKTKATANTSSKPLIVPSNLSTEQLPDFLNDRSPHFHFEPQHFTLTYHDSLLESQKALLNNWKQKRYLSYGVMAVSYIFAEIIPTLMGLEDFFHFFIKMICWAGMIGGAYMLRKRWEARHISEELQNFHKEYRHHKILDDEVPFTLKQQPNSQQGTLKELFASPRHGSQILLSHASLSFSQSVIKPVKDSPALLAAQGKNYSTQSYISLTHLKEWQLSLFESDYPWENLASEPMYVLHLSFDKPFVVYIGSGDSRQRYEIYQRELLMPLSTTDAKILKGALQTYWPETEHWGSKRRGI